MSLLKRAMFRGPIDEAIADGTYGQAGYGEWLSGMVWQPTTSTAGVEGAAQLTAVYGAWRLLSDAIGTLPVDVFERTEDGRGSVALPPFLTFPPGGVSRIEYFTQLILSLLTDGNAFVATPRDKYGVPTSLVPLNPYAVTVEGSLASPVFRVGPNTFTPYDIMHISGMVQPGQVRAMSPLRYAREVIDGSRQAQRYGGELFRNSAVPPAVLRIPATNTGPTDEDQVKAKRIVETWNERHQGADNSGRIGVLLGGASLESIAIPPEDAQWLETRRFGIQEIARIYGVPPHLLADSSNSTSWGTGLAEQNLAFAQFSLLPWTTRVEHAHDRLFASYGRSDLFLRLNLDARLRASLKDRYESYRVGILSGFLTRNEARRLEDLPPIAGGDDLFDPLTGTLKGEKPDESKTN